MAEENIKPEDLSQEEKSVQIALALGYRWILTTESCIKGNVTVHWCLRKDRQEEEGGYMAPIVGLKGCTQVSPCLMPLYYSSVWGREQIFRWLMQRGQRFHERFVGHLHDTTTLSGLIHNHKGMNLGTAIKMHLITAKPEEVAEAFYRTISAQARRRAKPAVEEVRDEGAI